MEEKYYLIILECGHVGHHNALEVARYFKDSDILDAYVCAREMPRSKKKNASVKIVKQISYDDYMLGKQSEKENIYLNTFAS